MTLRTFQIFRAGSHVSSAGIPLTFSEADLRVTAGLYNTTKDARARLVIGHPADDRGPLDGGEVRTLIVRDKELWATAEVTEPLAELVRTRRYGKVSAAFHAPRHARNPYPGCWTLRHVGFLGAMPPAVKGMAEPMFHESFELPIEFVMGGDMTALCSAEFSERAAPRNAFVEAFHSTAAIPGISVHERVQFAEHASGKRYGAA